MIRPEKATTCRIGSCFRQEGVWLTTQSCLERVPITWNHVIEKDSLKIKELEHVLMRHRIYPMSKYRKSRATFSGHALGGSCCRQSPGSVALVLGVGGRDEILEPS